MIYLLTTIHILVCVFLIIIVLLQSGKAADLAGAFGGMGSQTAFGPRGAATVLSKATTVCAVLFMMTSIVLSISATRRGGVGSSVLDSQKSTKQAPSKTGQPAKAPLPPPGPGEIDVQVSPDPKQSHEGHGHEAPKPGSPAGPAPAEKKAAPAEKK